MGLTHVQVRMQGLNGHGTPFELEFLVDDTGSIDCLAPAEYLHAAGIQPEGRAVYELANGTAVEYEFGFARLEFAGAKTVAQVIFGPKGVEPILGAVALENTNTTVDSASRTLKRLPTRSLK